MFALSWWICLLGLFGCSPLMPRNWAWGFMTRSTRRLWVALPLSILSLTTATVLVPLRTWPLVPPGIVSWPLGGGLVGTWSSCIIWQAPWLPPLLWWISMGGLLAPLLLLSHHLLLLLCQPCRHLQFLWLRLLSLLAISASAGCADLVSCLLWVPLLCLSLCCFSFLTSSFGGV